MQIEALKIYCDVVTHRSFSVAADKNGITQSTASQSVHRLEEYFGTELIDRSNRPWKVTETGRKCFTLSRDVLEAYDRLEREVSDMQHLNTTVRVGSIYSVGFTYMSDCMKIFERSVPGDDLQVEYLHPEVIPQRVLSGELDLGIISFAGNRRDLKVVPWLEEEMVLVCSPEHELSSRKAVWLPDVDGRDFVCFDNDLRISREITNILRETRVSRRVCMNFDNIEAIKRAVEDGNYLAILPLPTLRRELAVNSLCAIPFNGVSLRRPLSIIYKKGKKLTPVLDRFIGILQQTAEHQSAKSPLQNAV